MLWLSKACCSQSETLLIQGQLLLCSALWALNPQPRPSKVSSSVQEQIHDFSDTNSNQATNRHISLCVTLLKLLAHRFMAWLFICIKEWSYMTPVVTSYLLWMKAVTLWTSHHSLGVLLLCLLFLFFYCAYCSLNVIVCIGIAGNHMQRFEKIT